MGNSLGALALESDETVKPSIFVVSHTKTMMERSLRIATMLMLLTVPLNSLSSLPCTKGTDCAMMLTPSTMSPLRGGELFYFVNSLSGRHILAITGNVKRPKILPKNSVPVVKPAGRAQRVDRSQASAGTPGGEFMMGINVTEPRTERRSPPKHQVSQTPNIRINNIDAGAVILNVKNELVLRKTKRAVEEAKISCDRGERSFKNMIDVLQRDIMEKYMENTLEKRTECKRDTVNTMLKASRVHGSLALRHAQNHTSSVVEDTSLLPLVVRRELLSAAEKIGDVAEIMSKCRDELIREGLRHNESEVPMTLWNAAAASATAASRAFEICAASIAGTKAGHDDQSRAALVASETRASILQSQLPEIPESVENGSANECEADVCSIDRWAHDTEKATKHIKQDGCLHGCVGALIDRENRKLNQVIQFEADSTCKRYCSGVVTQPSVRRTVANAQMEIWESACLQGCNSGYTRRPPCLSKQLA